MVAARMHCDPRAFEASAHAAKDGDASEAVAYSDMRKFIRSCARKNAADLLLGFAQDVDCKI
jgi:hypothetical protein